MKVRLPNGTIIAGIPEGTSQAEVQRRAIAAGLATLEDFGAQAEPTPELQAAPTGQVDPDIVGLPGAGGLEAAYQVMDENEQLNKAISIARERDIGDEFLDFLPTGTEMVGGVTGLALTRSPKGAVVGATTGYGVGETLRQMITGEEDVNRLLVGLGLAATAESLAGPITKLLKKGIEVTPRVLHGLGVDLQTANTISQALKKPELAEAGTLTSKEETQALLQSADPYSGLRPAQVMDTWSKKLSEAFGRAGIGGQERFDALTATNEAALQSLSNKLIDGINSNRYTYDEAGEIFYNILQKGNKALSESYQQAESKFLLEAGDIRVNTARTKSLADDILKEGTAPFSVKPDGTPIGDALSTQVKTVLSAVKNIRSGATPKEIDTVIKSLNELSTEAGNTLGQTSPSTAKINQIVNALRRDLKESLPPGLQKQYESMKSGYAASKKNLFPSALRTAMRRGKEENFNFIGQALSKENNANFATQAFKALDEAKKLNPKLNTFEAEQAIRSGYLENIFKSGEMTIDEMASFYDKVNKNKTTRETFQAVLGDSTDAVFKIFRAAKDATSDPVNKGALSLFVAGRQVAAFGQATAGFATASAGEYLATAAILTSPAILARFASNPKTANKLLNLERMSSKMSPRVFVSSGLKLLRDIGYSADDVNNMLKEQGLQPIQE